jgi:hypothetical protein
MVKEGEWEREDNQQPITSYAVLEPNESVMSCDGVIVDICFWGAAQDWGRYFGQRRGI